MKKIPLIKRNEIIDYALVDDEDYEWLSKNRWCKQSGGYAVRIEGSRKTKKYIWMHKCILEHYGADYSGDKVTHHKDHNKINNQKNNIEAVGRKENQQSRRKPINATSSKYKGVYHYPKNKLWKAQVTCDNKTVFCRYFKSEDDAGYAYNYYAKMYHGEYAILNILPDDYIENPEILKIRGKGVSKRKFGMWEAAIFDDNGKYNYLGHYRTQIEAEIAYNIAAVSYFGDKATLNEIPKESRNIVPQRTTRKYRGDIKYDTSA